MSKDDKELEAKLKPFEAAVNASLDAYKSALNQIADRGDGHCMDCGCQAWVPGFPLSKCHRGGCGHPTVRHAIIPGGK